MRCPMYRKIMVCGFFLLLVYECFKYNDKTQTPHTREKLFMTNEREVQSSKLQSGRENLADLNPTKVIYIRKETNNISVIPMQRNIPLPLTLTGDYILNNPVLCSGTENLVVLVMVHTAPGHFERRQNIRSTYGSSHLFDNKVRVLFLLGTVENEFLRGAIIQEHTSYKDTVQGNFIDSYHNLTHKGVMGFRWITEYCSHVKYVVKVDDDAVFDMWRFLRFFGSKKHATKSILCRVVYRPSVPRTGKWEIDTNSFKNISRWEFNYCPGFAVILTGDVIAQLFKAAHTTPFLWIDDVYLFGLLPLKAGNMRIYQMPSNVKVTSYEDGTACFRNKGKDCDYLAVSFGFKESDFHLFWNLIKKRNGIK